VKRAMILSNDHIYTYNLRKELIERLIEEGFKVYLALPYGEKVQLLVRMGCEFVELALDRRGMNPIRDLKLLLGYYRILQSIRPDVVLSYTVKPNLYGGLVCRLLRIPFFPNVTGLGTAFGTDNLTQRALVQMYKVAHRKASCVFFQNEQNERFLMAKGVRVQRSRLVPGSGVNITEHCYELYPESDEVVRFLFIGRIMKEKGIEELVDAAIEIRRKYNNVQFDAIGFVEEDYRNRVEEIGGLGVVNFHGVKDNVHQYIKACHAVVLPSYHEGMANVLLEGASTGRPVLASNIPGCRETFDEGISGFGFEPRNVDDLTDALIRFIDLPLEQKKEMGIAGRQKMEREFDRRLVVDVYMKEITRVLGQEVH